MAAVTPVEYLAMRKGKADPETRNRVLQALRDPQSELNQWLTGVADWAKLALDPSKLDPGKRLRSKKQSPASTTSTADKARKILESHIDLLRIYCEGISAKFELDADELLSETYLIFLRSQDSKIEIINVFSEEMLGSYLTNFARDTAYDMLSWKVRERKLIPIDEASSIENSPAKFQVELPDFIKVHLERLPTHLREVLVCRFFYRMTISEISLKLDMSSGEVYRNLMIALHELRVSMDSEGFSPLE